MRNLSHRASAPLATAPVRDRPACSAPRFFAYWLLALAAAVAAFASHIYIRHRVVELGYALGHERSARARMENERRDLELELAAMEAPGDLAQISRDVLGLDVPRDEQLLAVGQETGRTPGPGAPAATTVVVQPASEALPPEPAAEPVAATGEAPPPPGEEASP
ncbi:MAG: cell division protein FtsL [Deltaproteobacteria bacterium]|nr:cell division protein FtsL [Deltaproteobacteria bacterium]